MTTNHRKTSTDSFSSSKLGIMNLDKLAGERKVVGALVNKLLLRVSLSSLSSYRPFSPTQSLLLIQSSVQLPMASGRSLASLESDPVVQETIYGLKRLSETRLATVAHALTGVLDGLAKQTWNIPSAELPLSVVQTQLLLTQTLSGCMDSYWRYHHLKQAPLSTNKTSEDETSCQKPWPNPPPIDEPLAKFILGTVILLLRMTTYEVPSSVANVPGYTGSPAGTFMTKGQVHHPPLGRSIVRHLHAAGRAGAADLGFRYKVPQDSAFQSTSVSAFDADPSSAALSDAAAAEAKSSRNNRPSTDSGVPGGASQHHPVSSVLYEISAMVGRIVFFLSSSSWPVVFARIRNRVLYLSSATEEHPDAIEMRLLEWCNLDHSKLVSLIKGMSLTYTVAINRDTETFCRPRICDSFPTH